MFAGCAAEVDRAAEGEESTETAEAALEGAEGVAGVVSPVEGVAEAAGGSEGAIAPNLAADPGIPEIVRTPEVAVEPVPEIPELEASPGGVLLELVNLQSLGGGQYSVDVRMVNASPVGGFQFTLAGASPESATNGRAGAEGFTVSTGEETGIVLGFHWENASLTPGDSVLTQMTFSAAPGVLCLTDIVIASPEARNVDAMAGDCIAIED